MNMALLRVLASCAMLAASVWAHAAEYAPLGVAVKPLPVGPHSYYVQGMAGPADQANQGFNANAGFVVTADGVVVIDALGTPALGKALVDAIGRITVQPIRRVIVTHYHADHYYGLQAMKEAGAEVWAHHAAREYLHSNDVKERYAQRKRELAPWVDDSMRFITADRWLDRDATFTLGGLTFDVVHVGPAHAPEDIAIYVREDGVLYSGDIVFSGRVPFVGDADSKRWLAVMDRLLTFNPRVLVPGHGAASREPKADLALTRDYLTHLRQAMGKAVDDFTPFDEAYAKTDWSRFAKLPAFDAANRVNAYGTYLLMEKESLQR
jgi:glyoxylase-like metal-dependent hydrolase (beta-lactamase superfamily II)